MGVKPWAWVGLAVVLLMTMRRSTSSPGSRVVGAARSELQTWAGRPETDPSVHSRLLAYWQATGLSASAAADAVHRRAHWSAAFISYVMSKAGVPFTPAPAHVDYLAAAKRQGRLYRIHQRSPQVGDLVCMGRDESGVTFDNLDDGHFRPAHCDIVVGRSGNRIQVIGGNVSDSVSLREFALKNSYLSPPFFAVMKV
jgi:hypothetical protein